MTRSRAYTFQNLEEAKSLVLSRLDFELRQKALKPPDWYLEQLDNLSMPDAYFGPEAKRSAEERRWDVEVSKLLDNIQRTLRRENRVEYDKFTEAIAYLRDEGYFLGILGARARENSGNLTVAFMLVAFPTLLAVYLRFGPGLSRGLNTVAIILMLVMGVVWLFLFWLWVGVRLEKYRARRRV